MAERQQITIHQTLHGYHEGHKLLATSIELNASEKTILSQLSDSSGTGKEKNFTSYITGYPLVNSRFYALARTWYADEMPRPGCVWTQTLLIDISAIWKIKNPQSLLSLFIRPQQSNYNSYSINIEIDADHQQNLKNDETFYKLSCLYYSENKKVVIPSDSSQFFEESILAIWNYQWPRLKRNFKFCTGSLSLRKLGNDIFDLQIIPYSRERSLNRYDKSMYEIIDFVNETCSSSWYEDYKKSDLKGMLEFMTTYGAELSPLKSRFPAMVQSFSFINSNGAHQNENLFDFWNKHFNDPQEGRALKIALVEDAFKKIQNNRFDILNRLLEDAYWDSIDWDFSTLISFAYKNRSISKIQTIKLLHKLKIKGFDLFKLLVKLPTSTWIEELELYRSLIPELSPRVNILTVEEFWKAPFNIQESWWNVLRDNVGNKYSEVIFLMLNNKHGPFAQDILKICGEKTFETVFYWMLQTKNDPTPEWQYLVVLNPIGAFKQLSLLPSITSPIIGLFLENVSPTSPEWKKVPIKTFTKFFELVEQLDEPLVKSAVYTYFLTACFTGNVLKPELFVEYVFQHLHNYLERNICEKDSWQRFKMELGRDLYGLLELDFFSKHFKDRQEVPDWDRCEFLRRSLLSCFLKFDWDITMLIYIINNDDTFEKTINFGVDVKPIRKLLKNLRKTFESEKVVHNQYYKILKKAL